MNAKSSDMARIQEIWNIGTQTKRQIEAIRFTRERFLTPENDQDDLIAEGLMNRVLRITEEAGRISSEISEHYGFERRAASGVRNRLAHAYGEVDREIIWEVISQDLDALLEACQRYCDDLGLELA